MSRGHLKFGSNREVIWKFGDDLSQKSIGSDMEAWKRYGSNLGAIGAKCYQSGLEVVTKRPNVERERRTRVTGE